MKNGISEERDVHEVGATNGTSLDPKSWSVQEIHEALTRGSFDAERPYLRINVTDIKDKLAQFRDLEVPRNQLAKRVKVPSVRANCSLTIWRRQAGETVVEQVRTCEIRSKTLASGERWASVTLESPFEVPIEDLKPKPDSVSTFAEGPSFSLELKLMAENLKDAWPPVDLKRVPLPKKPYFYEGEELVRLPILIAKWHRLPDIPRTPKESLLDLRAYQTSPSDQTKYVDYIPKLGLVVDIDWYITPSPLQQANREIQTKPTAVQQNDHEAPKRASSSPQARSASPEPKSEVTGHTEWVFEGLLDTVPARSYPAYHCPFCPLRHSKTEKRMRRFGGADEFCIHLKNNHSALRWEYVPRYRILDESMEVVHDGKISVRPCTEYDELATGMKGSDPRELSWIRPKEPLDVEAFLKGDESWLGKKKKVHTSDMPRNLEGSRPRASDHARTETVRRRPPEEVPNIPLRPRRTFKVPKAPPGVRFYRNVTKRVLEEGEDISESDDDIDEEWLLQKHADTIDSFTDTTRSEKEFIHRFDRHVLREDLASDLHASEALIRFCRQNYRWLRREDMRLEFHKKVASLKIQGSISGRVIWACMNIIKEGVKDDLNQGNAVSIAKDTIMKFNYGPDPMERGHTYGQCKRCNKVIRDPRKLVRCANPTCPQPEYHLACVNLTTRPIHWRCQPCLAAPQAGYGAWRSPNNTSLVTPMATPVPNASPRPNASPSVAPHVPSVDQMELTTSQGSDGPVTAAAPMVNGHPNDDEWRPEHGDESSSDSESGGPGEGSSQADDGVDRRRSNRHRRASGRSRW